jgi:hypothetical protein
VRLNRFVGAYDAGRIINPKTARSQAIGGIIWGVGQALLEQSETDPASGQFRNRNYSGYLVPTNADIAELDVLFVGGIDEEASDYLSHRCEMASSQFGLPSTNAKGTTKISTPTSSLTCRTQSRQSFALCAMMRDRTTPAAWSRASTRLSTAAPY